MEQLTLSVGDLISLRNILEAAISRGAYKANELSAVGGVYDKLHAFVETAQQQLQANTDQPETPVESANAEQAQGEENA